MSSRPSPLVGLAAVMLGALGPALAACESAGVSAFGTSTPGGSNSDEGGGGTPELPGDAGEPDAPGFLEGAAAVATAYQGSPLCNASPVTSTCYPDAFILCQPTAYGSPSDAGVADAPLVASQVPFGCHVAPAPGSASDAGAALASGQQVAPACSSPAGLGVDGFPCKDGSDCGPGYECVSGFAGGTCRHYCCAGNSACRKDQFCDIQHTAQGTPMSLPVCMPVESCDLLVPSCPAGETCAVVRDDGSKSCVATGNAQAGDRCETEHCAAGLVCLGVPGVRFCYALCAMKIPGQCPPSQSCKGGLPLFLDPGSGICE